MIKRSKDLGVYTWGWEMEEGIGPVLKDLCLPPNNKYLNIIKFMKFKNQKHVVTF